MAPHKNTATVLGLGYVGLPTAALLASRGFRVTGVDIDGGRVDAVNRGEPHIGEAELKALVRAVVGSGALVAAAAPVAADVHVIATPTPIRPDKTADVSYVEAAARALAPVLSPGCLVVIESTCPVGTTEAISAMLAGMRPDLSFPHQEPDRSDVMIAYCPERVLPGNTLHELRTNARMVGGLDTRSGWIARDTYARIVEGPISTVAARVAELVKLLENASRDVALAFANEISLICDRYGLDPREVIGLANQHPRVNILNPGPGVGGHCIPVDPWFLHEAAPDLTPLIAMARQVNDGKPAWVARRILDEAARRNARTISLLGLAYKPDVGDMRGSPAVEIARIVGTEFGGRVLVTDPEVETLPVELAGLERLSVVAVGEAIAAGDVVAILCAHTPYRTLDPATLAGKAVVDPCGIFPRTTAAADSCAYA